MQLQIDRRPDGRIIIEIPGAASAVPERASVRTSVLRTIGSAQDGGIHAGLTIERNDPVDLVLLPGEFEGTWKDALAWAKSQGGVLPSRVDALILRQNLPGEFRKEAYWTAAQHAVYSDSAWYQHFYYGTQSNSTISSRLRARAVRRLVIE